MKIGILTLPIAENYGGILQAVALYQLLEQKGHEVSLIYKPHVPQLWKEAIRKILEIIPGHNLYNVKTTKKLKSGAKQRRELHRPFIEAEINDISPSLKNRNELTNYALQKKFDAIIVGSDQVWRKAYINDRYYKSYFLDFIPKNSGIKKIAYAASFGKDHWEGKGDSNEIKQLLADFTAISVRESSGIKICKQEFNTRNVKHVLDPTLLMPKEFYIEMINQYDLSKTPKRKLVTYVLDESFEKRGVIQYFQNKLEVAEGETRHLRGFNPSNHTYTVPEWLHSIAQADFVITDSFHGMAFSIIFEKQFIVIGNRDRGLERFSSLLKLLELDSRLLIDPSQLNDKSPIDTIDFIRVNKKLKKLSDCSSQFLLKALRK